MRGQGRVVVRCCVLGLVLSALPRSTGEESSGAPESKIAGGERLIERTRRDLAQLDVTVEGPAEAIATLTTEDFGLFVGGDPIEKFTADRLCRINKTPESPGLAHAAVEPEQAVAPTTYLFYFDQHQLTLEGRYNALHFARVMTQRLIQGGNRAAILSVGRSLATVADFTDDREVLLAALDRLEQDRKQFDEYPTLEQNRQRDVVEAMEFSTLAACNRARVYQREETARTERAMNLLATVLGRFADIGAPKVVVYFADNLRIDPGRHFFQIVRRDCRPSSFDARGVFQNVVETAAAMEVRVYSVHAQGLVPPPPLTEVRMRGLAVSDAQSGLKAIALDTGGDAFLHGVSAERATRRLEADSSCVYLLSFDPSHLPTDEALRVRVEIARPGVRVRTRSQVVIQSEAERKTSRLLAAFATPNSTSGRLPVEAAVVPIAFENGRFRAMVQVSAPESVLPRTEWDLGVSQIVGGAVREETSGRILINRPGVRPVLEIEMVFRPGPFELLVVAFENLSGELGAASMEGVWPDDEGKPGVGPVVVLQPATAVFVRDGVARSEGSLAVPRTRAMRSDLPTALIGLVCRGSQRASTLSVDRRLTGENAIDFPPLALELGDEPCAQIRDLIPAHTLAEGRFAYEARVVGTDVTTTLDFVVGAPRPEPTGDGR